MSPTAFDAKAPLTEESIVKAAELEVDDVDGKKVKFGTLFENEKAVVVFIRAFSPLTAGCCDNDRLHSCVGHFFCGVSNIPPDETRAWTKY